MITRAIPSTGETLPVIGMGTWQTFDVGGAPGERAPLEMVMREFVEAGGTLVDSSPMYGNAEQVVGDVAMRTGVANRLFVATKVWTTGRTRGFAQMEDSMRKLRVERVDLMQVHNLLDAATHLATLRQWKAEGRVRYVGITHYTASAHADVVHMLERETVDFVQINYSAFEREAETSVLPVALDRGVAVLANRPLGAGRLSRLQDVALPSWASELGCSSWSQLLLKFVIAHPAVTCAIPATSRPEHLRANMAVGDGELPDEAMRRRIVELVARL